MCFSASLRLIVLLSVSLTLFGCGDQQNQKQSVKQPPPMASGPMMREDQRSAVLISRDYRRWAQQEVKGLKRSVDRLSEAAQAGSAQGTRSNYRDLLIRYERLRPAAEAFPDQDRALAAYRSDVSASEWRGLRRLEQELFPGKNVNSALVRRLIRELKRDLEALDRQLVDLALSGRDQIRAASHLLSDVESFDLAERSLPKLPQYRDELARARVEGAQKLWSSVEFEVRSGDPQLAGRVERGLRGLIAVLEDPAAVTSRRHETTQQVDRVANQLAQTARFFR